MDLREHDLYCPETLLVIGSRPDLLSDRVKRDRPNLFANSERSMSPEMQELREIELPRRALAAIITEGADESIGGMDARLDPAKYGGLAEGDAHVIRNAGGRASDDAIRSLVISYKLLGTREWFVVHHTDCGAPKFVTFRTVLPTRGI